MCCHLDRGQFPGPCHSPGQVRVRRTDVDAILLGPPADEQDPGQGAGPEQSDDRPLEQVGDRPPERPEVPDQRGGRVRGVLRAGRGDHLGLGRGGHIARDRQPLAMPPAADLDQQMIPARDRDQHPVCRTGYGPGHDAVDGGQ